MKLSIYQVISTSLALQAAALPTDSDSTAIDPIDIDISNVEPITINPEYPSTFIQEASTPTTVALVEVETTTEAPAGTPTPDWQNQYPPVNTTGKVPYGFHRPGKPLLECWYEKKMFRSIYHLTGMNWNVTENEFKSYCKKSDLMTIWAWEEHINSAGGQTFLVQVRLFVRRTFFYFISPSSPPILSLIHLSCCGKKKKEELWANLFYQKKQFQLPIKTAARLEKNLKNFVNNKASLSEFPDLPEPKCRSHRPDVPLNGQAILPPLE